MLDEMFIRFCWLSSIRFQWRTSVQNGSTPSFGRQKVLLASIIMVWKIMMIIMFIRIIILIMLITCNSSNNNNLINNYYNYMVVIMCSIITMFDDSICNDNGNHWPQLKGPWTKKNVGMAVRINGVPNDKHSTKPLCGWLVKHHTHTHRCTLQ